MNPVTYQEQLTMHVARLTADMLLAQPGIVDGGGV